MLSKNKFIITVLSIVLTAMFLAGCASNEYSYEETEIHEFTTEAEEYHVTWSDQEKAIIEAMYASTKYSDTKWKHIAYNMLDTGKKDNPIVRNFPCWYYCELIYLAKNKQIIVNASGHYYEIKTKKIVDFSRELTDEVLPIEEFPRKATLGEICNEYPGSCSYVFMVNNNIYETIASQDLYPNARYLTQKKPFDPWEPNKK